MNLTIKTKELSKIGYTGNVIRSIATTAINRHCKHCSKEDVLAELADVLQNPARYAGHKIWGYLAEHLCPQIVQPVFTSWQLRDQPQDFMAENISKMQHGDRWNLLCVCR